MAPCPPEGARIKEFLSNWVNKSTRTPAYIVESANALLNNMMESEEMVVSHQNGKRFVLQRSEILTLSIKDLDVLNIIEKVIGLINMKLYNDNIWLRAPSGGQGETKSLLQVSSGWNRMEFLLLKELD